MKRQPTHPGAILREDVLPYLGISVSALARALHVSRQTVHGILNESKPITPNTALRLGKFIGNGPGVWLRMQEAHDLYKTEHEIADDLNEIQRYQYE